MNMTVLGDSLSWVLLVSGSLCAVTAGVGMLRLPHFFARIHGAGLLDSMAAALILPGLAVQAGFSLLAVKLILILAFLLLTGPTAMHALARAALHGRMDPRGQSGNHSKDR